MNFNFHLPTKIIFGCGKVKELSGITGTDINRILIVTDKNVFEKSGAKDVVHKALKSKKVSVFDEVEENPSFSTLLKGVNLAKEVDAQMVVGIGGGSPMDAAKGIAVLATNSGDIMDYIGGDQLNRVPLPVVCIPTTSGTGSEVTPYAVFTDQDNEKKVCLATPEIFPGVSIIDPELTYSMPAQVTINTGVDVLTHAIEAYLSLDASPMSDLYSLEAITNVLNNLEPASKKNKESMNTMAYASMLAGVAITHAGTILLHIMAYSLTIYHHIPHGRANGILLPAFMEFMNTKSNTFNKVKTIEKLFQKFNGVNNFIQGLDISTRLSSYGIKKKDFEKWAEETIIKDDINITPATVTKKDIIEIYQSIF